MRLIIITAFFLISTFEGLSQETYKIQPTKYDSFIRSTQIRWAVRSNPNFLLKKNSFNLWNYLYKEWMNESLKIYAEDSQFNYISSEKVNDLVFDTTLDHLKKVFMKGMRCWVYLTLQTEVNFASSII